MIKFMSTKFYSFVIPGIIILVTTCKNPEASFIYECGRCVVGDSVQFTNTSINAETFDWDFGDGNASTEENPVHIYNETGTFNVLLTISNSNGSDGATGSVIIKGMPGLLIDTVVYSPSIEGNLLGDSPGRNVTIYLPPGYETSDKHYPVIYLLHGYTGDNRLWFEKRPGEVNLEPIMNDLINNKTIEPMILVSPDSYNRFGGSWYINSVSSGNWEDFIVQDVVQFVDAHFRTIANTNSRGIAGHSMGGYGTMMIAMKHPDIFSAAYGLSSNSLVFDPNPYPYLNSYRTIFTEIYGATDIADFDNLSWDARITLSMSVAMVPNTSEPPFYCDYMINSSGEFVLSVWQRLMPFDPYTSITTYEQNILQLTAIYIDCGDLDGNLQSNITFGNKLATIGIPGAFESYAGDHTNKLAERMESKVLPFFSKYLVHEDSE
jgi:S-formylglutathione hydrolase